MHGLTAGAVVAAVVAGVAAQSCDVVDFNYYCKKVNKITYHNAVASGTYNKVTSMDDATGACSSEPQDFSGNLGPLTDDLSFHFRGPGSLKQFAVYYPSKEESNVKVRSPHSDFVKHGHQHFHQKMHEKRDAAPAPTPRAAMKYDAAGQPEWIVATMGDDVVSWTNSYYQGAPAAPTSTPEAEPVSTPSKGKGKGQGNGNGGSTTVQATHGKPAPVIPGDWVRTSYYNAEQGVAHDVTFLNNKGGAESGTFSYTFGNSLGYATSDGVGCSGTSQTLADTTIPSNEEVIIMSGRKCENGDCGFVRPGSVAYHGWAGEAKAFFMEFSMPDDGETGFNANMPAAWMLNAQIPRTLQYGNADCSCWKSGCGEVDLFETLAAGETRMKSTLHGALQGGDSDYFERPTAGTMKAAVVFQGQEIHIQVLKNEHEFSTVLTQATMESVMSTIEEIASSFFDLLSTS